VNGTDGASGASGPSGRYQLGLGGSGRKEERELIRGNMAGPAAWPKVPCHD
jgi:hypothetical protein